MLLKHRLFSRRVLRHCRLSAAATPPPPPPPPPAAATATPTDSVTHPPAPPDSTTRERSSRIFIIGRRKEEEVEVSEALRALRAYSLVSYPETVAVDIRVDMTIKKDKVREAFRGPVVYPHSFGQKRVILFVLESEFHTSAREAGADIVGAEEIFPQLEEGELKFDVCLTTPSMLDMFKPFQRILKAKMPNVRRGTVVSEDSISEAVQQFQTKREFKSDKKGNILLSVGKLDFPDEHITDNITTLLRGVASHHGNIPQQNFIQKALLTSSYGPSFAIRTKHFL